LTIAYSVRDESSWRYDNEVRMRVRIGMRKLRRKVRNMIADALDDRDIMEEKIELRLKCNRAAVTAVEIIRKIMSKKRPVESTQVDNFKRARME
ncbi:hypothetical protein PENTCL1PPCAC_17281, partial [Pristionchus entomophagus]